MTLKSADVPRWGYFEQAFIGTRMYANPFQDVSAQATFTAPSGKTHSVDLFWNGSHEWRVRFMPDEVGAWHFEVHCSDETNSGIQHQNGDFTCSPPTGKTRFEQHGRLQLSNNRRYLAHADGTPFFWLGDTAWNGPLCSTPEEWKFYLAQRQRQQFTAVQWVATQWISAPDGDLNGELAYSGHEHILVHPSFFQRLDQKIIALNRAGLLSVPIMLWAAHWSRDEVNARNPGYTLAEDQAIRLARYMLARWGAYHTVWLLPGDGDYRGERSDRWKRIGRAVFGETSRELVALHPGDMQWNMDDFRNEAWLNLVGYQSGHGDDDRSVEWLVGGPPSMDWHQEPARPFINLESPYEDIIAYQSRRRHDDYSVRQGLYWSLLVAPTAGVTYGGHGVWGWDDGSAPPIGHDNTGITKPWQQALMLPGAEQLRHLMHIMTSLAWWKLQPAQEVLAVQPGHDSQRCFIAAARTDDLLLIYLPENNHVQLKSDAVGAEATASWFNPRTGEQSAAPADERDTITHFHTPGQGDWLLLIQHTAS